MTPIDLGSEGIAEGGAYASVGANESHDATCERRQDRSAPQTELNGGKDQLGNIRKRGDRYLRSLFTTGALAVIR